MVLVNLPREIRFRKKNVIIIGVIPGPKKPKENIIFFLKPLVDELLDLWNGIIIKKNDDEAYFKLFYSMVLTLFWLGRAKMLYPNDFFY